MAGTIKGLKIEIGGETTQLTEALKKPAQATKDLKADLKNVNTALKFDTSNVELLNKKQEILRRTISSTEDELKILKEAQKQYIDSGGDLNASEYIDLEKKIALVQKSLENLQEQQNNFSGSLQAFGDNVKGFGEKTENLGKKFLPVTAGVTAIGTAAIASFNEIDEGYDTIVTKTGATGDALDGLTESMDNVFGNLPTTAADAGIAIGEVNTRFGLTGDALEDLSEQFIMFSQINETDLNGAIGSVNKNLQVFGLGAEDAGGYLGILTERAQATGISVDDLMNSVQKNGPVFKEMGLGIDESVNLLAEFEKNGVNADAALAGLRKAQQNATAEGKTLSNSLSETIEKIKGTSDETEALQIATELFGKKGAMEMTQAIREGRFSVDDLSASLGDFGSTVKDTFEGTQDPPDQMTVAMNNLKIAGKELGDTIMTAVAPILQNLADKAKNVAEWFKGLSDEQKELVVKLGAVAAAVGPVLIGVGKLATGLGKTFDYFGKTSTAGGKLVSSLKGMFGAVSVGVGPLLAVAAAVAAVGGAFFDLWNNNEEFRNKMMEIWNSIVGKVQEFCHGIVDRINELGFNFKDITEVVKAVWKEFCDFMAPIFEGVWKQVENIITAALDIIMGVVDTFIALFKGDWDGFWAGIQSVWDACWSYINDTVKNIVDTILKCISEFLSWFGIEWNPNLDAISQKWQDIWGSIGNFIDSIIQTIQNLVAGFIDLFNGDWDGFCSHLSEAWDSLWEGVKEFASDIWGTISSLAEKAWDGICSTASRIWNGICDAIKKPIETAKEFVNDCIEAIKGFFNFEFKWPHIPLPHFSISGSANPFDWFSEGLPSIGIDWYAKAMPSGMILDQPTVFGFQNGKFLGGGEAGQEVVVGAASLRSMIDESVSKAMQKYDLTAQMMPDYPDMSDVAAEIRAFGSGMIDALGRMGVYIDKEILVGQMVDGIDRRLGRIAQQRGRGY